MRKYISICANELDTYLDYTIFTIIAIYTLYAFPSLIGILGACFAIPFFMLGRMYGIYFDKGDILRARIIFFSANSLVIPLILLSDSMIHLYIIVLIKSACRCGIAISNTKLNREDKEAKRFYELYGYMINVSRIFIPLLVIYLNANYGLWVVVLLSVILNLTGMLVSVFDDKNKFRGGGDNKYMERSDFSLRFLMKNNVEFYFLVFAYTLSNLAFFMSNDLLGIFFEKIGHGEKSIGFIITLLGVGGLLGTWFSGIMVKTQSSKNILVSSVTVNSVAFFGFGFLAVENYHYIIYYIFIFMVGISSGMTFFAIRYGVRNIVGYKNTAKVTGGIQKISSIVAILMPIGGGYLANVMGVEFTFKLTSIMLALIIVFVLFKKNLTTIKRSDCV
ncbi:hypothetical protein N5923_08735 [Erwiniaceae bacterium BAC15a-03b]|uniref:Major facilitator superfamily (MFS) profile domain-containing protein n=1 Tax=Winslowiella arboricola TaxID=2978220 RepID=A0A9J6PPN5_9GAMM|nr:MFS transporter [Winslowiella arboricola]MCU5771753.1 hypothetical protein [Winslowiella arboricola]MCU5777576.1 hypothetical protein [Winslowiella arboricola]